MKCFFCNSDNGSMVFDRGSDSYVHVDCIRMVLMEDPYDTHARQMAYLVDDEQLPHRTAHVRCRLCDHEFTSVHPVTCDETSLQCSNCWNMTAEVLEGN